MRIFYVFAVIILASVLAACGDTDVSTPAESTASSAVVDTSSSIAEDNMIASGGLTAAEANAVAPVTVGLDDAVQPLRIELLSERGYVDPSYQLVIDVIQNDTVEVAIVVTDAEDNLVQGAQPTITIVGQSQWALASEGEPVTDRHGTVTVGITAGPMGEEQVVAELDGARDEALLNVISLAANGYANLNDIEGVLSWRLLMEADIQWGEPMSAVFPDEVQASSGTTVKLAGFMMPLEMTNSQSRFVLTSNPPSCFFHIPGGPAGAVEVFVSDPIEVTWDPIVLEGRFEALPNSESGVLYRLQEARLIKVP